MKWNKSLIMFIILLIITTIFTNGCNKNILIMEEINTLSLWESLNIDINEVSKYYKELIEIGEIKPLSLLEITDREKYDIAIKYLYENEIVKNYFYDISIFIKINETTERCFSLKEYNTIKYLPEYEVLNIDRIEYSIFYYEIFLKKYSSWRGDPTGKCFTLVFNNENEFIRRYYWR